MKIKVWNAFASNNSGSYTIVGSFRDVDVANQVARDLAALCAAQSNWHDAQQPEADGVGSPLHAFIVANGLRWEAQRGGDDDWPEYGPPPMVAAVGHQVVVHAPYTVTMPPTFGELFYGRGGRVDIELDHSHDQLVAEISLWWPHEMKDLDRVVRVSTAIAELGSDDAVKRHLARKGDVPGGAAREDALVCRRGASWMDPHVLVGALFAELVPGVQAVAAIGSRNGAAHRVKIFESVDTKDPLGHLRAPT